MIPQEALEALRVRMGEAIVGQQGVIERLLIGLLANGNLLVEGLPGLAKTRAIKALAKNLECDFSRIQFTPDLLPSDVTGSEIYSQGAADAGGGAFRFQPGPIFADIVLADEINRAPPKVQAALLEAMEERQVTVGGTTHRMPPLFMVMATQNPIEQEGTYPLPEAQTDRFLMHVLVTWPSVEEEVEVIRMVRGEEIAAQAAAAPDAAAPPPPREAIPQAAIFEARREIAAIHAAPAIERYMADLVQATRTPDAFGEDLARWIEIGASPRASLALDRCGRAHAWLAGRDYVDPEDLRAVAPDVLRHRLRLSYEAQGEGVAPDRVVEEILARVALP
ncbi:AAA family ATPase [uncultured Albimonas sp.]|uniref:AAA family ATPase n=1 Tax=uncultured Albimonas sp. TaxID=1331701 RepID=UPI0030ECB6C8|tara:strand:+ start:2573 stop:3577 length:1005 start_codon:yes stop_codon:yes gene_type:complete